MKTKHIYFWQATRFNWYRNTSEWKPFHHDAAAMKPDKARTQNFTVAVSFGCERWILASDWSILITWPEYWPLIGQYWSCYLNTGRWLVNTGDLNTGLWLDNISSGTPPSSTPTPRLWWPCLNLTGQSTPLAETWTSSGDTEYCR